MADLIIAELVSGFDAGAIESAGRYPTEGFNTTGEDVCECCHRNASLERFVLKTMHS